MWYIAILIILYILYDVNYFIRTCFTVLLGRLQRKSYLNETTTIYGLCTLQDCDVTFRYIREARLLRELDFARYHFFDRTGIYQRIFQLKIVALQGCSMTLHLEPVPLFAFYKIITKLVYWDNKSMFFEHEVITLHDGKVRVFLVSRQQHAFSENGGSIADLLEGLPGSESKQDCPVYLEHWLNSIEKSSAKLHKNKHI